MGVGVGMSRALNDDMAVPPFLSRLFSLSRRSQTRVVLFGASAAVVFGAAAGCAGERDIPFRATQEVTLSDVAVSAISEVTAADDASADATTDGPSGDAGSPDADVGPQGIDGGYCFSQFPGCQAFSQPDGAACPAFDPSNCDRNWGWGEEEGASSPAGGSCCLGYLGDIKDAGEGCSQALNISDWTLCLNLLFLQCINAGEICTGGVTWVTDAEALGNSPPA